MLLKENILKLPKGELQSRIRSLAPGERFFGIAEKRLGPEGLFRRMPILAFGGESRLAIVAFPAKAKLEEVLSYATAPQQFLLPNIAGQDVLITAPKELAQNYAEQMELLSRFAGGFKPGDEFLKSLGRQKGSIVFRYGSGSGLYVSNYNYNNGPALQKASEMIVAAIGGQLLELAAFAKEIGVHWLESAYFAKPRNE